MQKQEESDKMKEFNVYIDESGDEGINKGSNYFILTAILVEKEKDLRVSKCVDTMKENLEMNLKSQLHWNKLKGYPNKNMIMSTISNIDITIINVVIDTRKMKFIPSIDMYNHFSGYLYERICWFLRDKKAVVNINISSRGENLTKASLTEFLKGHNDFRIDYSRIKTIKICPNAEKKLLQLADCCCSSLGQALKYHDEKHLSFIPYLKNKFYKYNRKYLGYGLKHVPGNIEYGKEFKELLTFLENKKM